MTDLGTSGLGREEAKWEERLGDKRTGKRGGEVGRTTWGQADWEERRLKCEERTWGQADWEERRQSGKNDLGTSGLGRGEVKWEERTWGQADWEEGSEVGRTDLGTSGLGRGG